MLKKDSSRYDWLDNTSNPKLAEAYCRRQQNQNTKINEAVKAK
jgi:hypothetical protein